MLSSFLMEVIDARFPDGKYPEIPEPILHVTSAARNVAKSYAAPAPDHEAPSKEMLKHQALAELRCNRRSKDYSVGKWRSLLRTSDKHY